MTPTEAVLEFRKREGLSDYNNASCSDVALFLHDRFPNSQIYGIEVWATQPALIGHFITKINGRYYDGETSRGVKNIRDIIKSRYENLLFIRVVKVAPRDVRRWQAAGQHPLWYQVRR